MNTEILQKLIIDELVKNKENKNDDRVYQKEIDVILFNIIFKSFK